jgi:RNA polymerase sigma-70 factor (ECF subfamily)
MKEKEEFTWQGQLEDHEIVELYWARDERAIEETSKKYEKYLYRIAYNIVKDRMDSEECVNDTYLNTWNGIPPARPSVLHVFLAKITRNLALDRFRKNGAAKRIPSEMTISLEELDEAISAQPSPEEEYLIGEISRVLNGYLRSLPPRSEFIFVCRYYYADGVEAIAQMLDVSRNTVSRELSAMRKGLRELLEKEGIR